MASMRVHELAKEFDMTSKELLDRLHEMKIPAKSHASMLADAYVDKIRKNLSPEIKQRAGKIDAEEAKQLAEEKAQEERKKAEEEASRRAAVEKVLVKDFLFLRDGREVVLLIVFQQKSTKFLEFLAFFALNQRFVVF